MTFTPSEDAPMPWDEEAIALEMVNRGEIELRDFEWLMGAHDPTEESVAEMDAKDRRRYFAIQAAQRKRLGLPPIKRTKRKKAA